MSFIVYSLLFAVIIFDLYLVFKILEYFYCVYVMHQAPLLASNKKLRHHVVEHLSKHYPHAKHICEIGSGFGGLARSVARKTNANIYALENMPFSVFISKTADIFLKKHNNTTIWCDAFEYLKHTDKHFDVAIAYLGPKATPKIPQYKDKIDVLISLDFEIPNLKPKRIIDLKCGYVIYHKTKYPHKLFIYEFNRPHKH